MHFMQINPLILPALALAVAAFIGGLWITERLEKSPWLGLAYAGAALLAVPGVLFTVYYLHWLDHAKWLYEFRTLPYSELTAAAMGFLAGMLPALLRKRRLLFLGVETASMVLLICWLSVPYLKMLFGPVNLSEFKDEYDKGAICVQTTASSCGPASAVTLLWRTGNHATERELARESYTTQSGTECWYMARALRSRGLTVRYIFLPEAPAQLIFHSIAGVRLGGPHGPGHFVTVLGEFRDTYVIGDPAPGVGKVYIKKNEVNEGSYYFTGFFMEVARER